MTGSPPAPTDLRVEDAETPLGLDARRPRFRWRFDGATPREQSAYRLRVASHPDPADDPDVWDSGWVASSESVGVAYDGPALEPRERYHWTVTVRDGRGHESGWSEPSWWETGLFGESPADWIAADLGGEAAPYLRRAFDLDAPVERARLSVAGLGYAEPYLNGERVGDRALDPALTDYDERVLYATYDVTDLVGAGANAVGAELGRGRYAEPVESTWGWQEAPWHADEPHLFVDLQIDLADGTTRRIVSEGTWRVAAGPTRYDSLYEGEGYDARHEREGWTEPGFDDGDWSSAAVVDGPGGRLVGSAAPPMRVVGTLTPEWVSEVRPDTYVFDVGEMVTGWAELAVEGPASTEVAITYGERRNDDGTVNVQDLYRGTIPRQFVEGDLQSDSLVLGGDGRETWAPRFSYKGFRYVEVEGYPGEPTLDDLTVEVVHSDVDAGSAFRCGNGLLERIHENTRRALLNNYHGLPTDTPVYEKNGWTGDAQLTAEAALYEFEAGPFFRKWLDDLADAQRESGEIPNIAPTSGWGYRDSSLGTTASPCPAWDAAYPLIAWWCYRHRGDRRLLAEHFENLCALVEYHAEQSEGGIVETGHGDHRPPLIGEHRADKPEGPAIVSTAYFHRIVEVVGEIARVLGRDAGRFEELAAEVRAAFDDAFLDESRGIYRTGEVDQYRQASNAVPLDLGLVPEAHVESVVENLVDDVLDANDGHLNTGAVGTKHLLPALTEHGHVDVAYEVASRTTYPSWGHWIVQHDATALYEAWELPGRSRDHHFEGSIDAWFHRYLAGIAPAEPGYRVVEIDPRLPTALDSAGADVETVRGTVSADWERLGDGIRLDVALPANTDGLVCVPGEDATVDGTPLAEASDATVEGRGDGRTVCRVPAGAWTFEC